MALARAVCAVRRGAGVVLLDEPTAQLDVRGEAQIFRRLLEATRGVTTILVSHRFSTVRHVDRICVVEDGRVVIETREQLARRTRQEISESWSGEGSVVEELVADRRAEAARDEQR